MHGKIRTSVSCRLLGSIGPDSQVIMEAKTDFVQQTLPIIGEGEKKLANIVVSITALEAMQSLV